MHLLRETYFRALALTVSFRILSKLKPLLVANSVDIISKLFKCSCCIDDLKYVLSSFSLESSILGMPRSVGWSIVNPEDNKQIKERGYLIRSLRGKMHNAIKRPAKQHTFAITN